MKQGIVHRLVLSFGIVGMLALGGVPTAMAATTSFEIESRAGACRFITDDPKIDYGSARFMSATVGREGCINAVSWLHGSLRKDGKGTSDPQLARFNVSNVNSYKQILTSWATKGDTYFTFASSSTGGSQLSGFVTSK